MMRRPRKRTDGMAKAAKSVYTVTYNFSLPTGSVAHLTGELFWTSMEEAEKYATKCGPSYRAVELHPAKLSS